MTHASDPASVSGRSEPRSPFMEHKAMIKPATITGRDAAGVMIPKPVLQFWCEDNRCGWAPWLDDPRGYGWADICDRVMKAHEGTTP